MFIHKLVHSSCIFLDVPKFRNVHCSTLERHS